MLFGRTIMKWVSIDGKEQPDMADKTLILPSCGTASADRMVVDLLCFNFCKLVGRLISNNLDFVASVDPFDSKSNNLASSVDVYEGELPTYGPVIVLRVAANMPTPKRQILDYAREIVEFAKSSHIKQMLLLRSISSVFCVDSQIADWPRTIRGMGKIIEPLKIKQLEEYRPEQEMLQASVLGEFFECLRRTADIDFGAVFIFVNDGMVISDAAMAAQIVSGKAELKIPESWKCLME